MGYVLNISSGNQVWCWVFPSILDLGSEGHQMPEWEGRKACLIGNLHRLGKNKDQDRRRCHSAGLERWVVGCLRILDAVRQYCWIQQGLNATWDPRAAHFSTPQSASGGRKSVKREGRFSTLTEGLSVQASGRTPSSDSPNFLGEEVGGWVSLEEGLPQHAFKVKITEKYCFL